MIRAAPAPRRYSPLSAPDRRRSGCNVSKYSVSVTQRCPNRRDRGGMRVCSFCGVRGVTLHNLHVRRGTLPETAYRAGRSVLPIVPIARVDDARSVRVFLAQLAPDAALAQVIMAAPQLQEGAEWA